MKKLSKMASASADFAKTKADIARSKLLSASNSRDMQEPQAPAPAPADDNSRLQRLASNVSNSIEGVPSNMSVFSTGSLDGMLDPSLFSVPRDVLDLAPPQRLEILDARIAELKWRLENEEIILDRLNKLTLKDKSAKYLNDVREQKSIVRYNIDRLNGSIIEHGVARDDSIVAQERGRLAEDLRESRVKRQELEAQLKELNTQCKLQQEELADFKMHAEGGRAMLNSHVITLNTRIDQLTQENMQLERKLYEAQERLQDGHVRDAPCSDHVEVISELKEEVKRLEALREKDAAYRAKLTQECQELNTRHQELEESQGRETARLKGDIASLEEKCERHEKALEEKEGVERALAETQKGVQAERAEVQRLTAAVAEKDAVISSLESEVASLKAELETVAKKAGSVEQLEARIERMSQIENVRNEKIDHLTREVEEARANAATAAALESELAVARRELTEKTGVIRDQESTIASLQRNLNADASQMHGELITVTDELDKARKAVLRLENELSEARATGTQRQKDSERMAADLARLERDHAALRTKLEEITEDRQAKDRQITDLTSTLRELVSLKDKEKAELVAQKDRERDLMLAAKESEIERLAEQVSASQAEAERLAATADKQSKDAKTMQARMKELEHTLRFELANNQDLNNKLIKTMQEKVDVLNQLEEMELEREEREKQQQRKRGLSLTFSSGKMNQA